MFSNLKVIASPIFFSVQIWFSGTATTLAFASNPDHFKIQFNNIEIKFYGI